MTNGLFFLKFEMDDVALKKVNKAYLDCYILNKLE